MADIIGPSLPPHLLSKDDGNDKKNDEKNKSIGPSLPPWLKTNSSPIREPDTQKNTLNREECGIDPSFGPSLPPGFSKKQSHIVSVEPAPPLEILDEMLPSLSSSHHPNESEDEGISDEGIIGPLPASKNDTVPSVAEEFERRSKKMKDRLTGKEKEKLEREEWMTELPPLLQGFGGGPRKFRNRAMDVGDRSVWTDTPADKAKRAQGNKAIPKPNDNDRVRAEMWAKRDKEIASRLACFEDSTRDKSLLSMHEESRKRKLEEDQDSEEGNVRRPFDRDIDLQANQFDDATKKRLLKKSQGLSSRFSHGKSSSTFL